MRQGMRAGRFDLFARRLGEEIGIEIIDLFAVLSLINPIERQAGACFSMPLNLKQDQE